MSANKINIITLGCSKNTVDSERLMRQLNANNFELVDSSDEADSVIINTCGFIDAAKEESINTILQAVELKKQGKLKKSCCCRMSLRKIYGRSAQRDS